MDFRQEFEDAMTKNSGPALRRAITMLMKMPNYRDAHATDDHFIPACFVAGAAGRKQDEGLKETLGHGRHGSGKFRREISEQRHPRTELLPGQRHPLLRQRHFTIVTVADFRQLRRRINTV